MSDLKKRIKVRRWNDFVEKVNKTANSARVRTMENFPQHRNTSCFTHSVAVAYMSCKIADKLGIKYDKKSMIRGAMLHDYFLYNWKDAPKKYRLHGFTHPTTALNNAARDFKLNPIEKDIIKKHMFPLTVIPPKYKESYLVSISDKICAVYEIFSKHPYKKIVKTFK